MLPGNPGLRHALPTPAVVQRDRLIARIRELDRLQDSRGLEEGERQERAGILRDLAHYPLTLRLERVHREAPLWSRLLDDGGD